MKGEEVVEDIGVYVYDEEEWLKDHDDCLPEKYLLKFDEARALLIHFAALEAQLKAAEARVKELEQGFREVLVCARNISEGYYEDAALLGRIARSFLVGRCTGAISHAVFVQRKLRKGGGCAKPTKQ